MRVLIAAAIVLIAGCLTAKSANAQPFHAGVSRITVSSEKPFDVLVWYPTSAEEVPWQAGPLTMPASRGAAFANGQFPIILLSHGGGVGGGTPLILREISVELARQGFVVIAPFHGKTGFQGRTHQVTQALDAVRGDFRFKSHVDSGRIGMLGFSLGTTVTLELAGAIPNVAHLVSYCAAHPHDAMSCEHAPDGSKVPSSGQSVPSDALHPPPALPLKAIALLDPFAVLFQRDELTSVTMPVLIYRPDQSQLPAEANATGLAQALPRHPQFQTVPGTHFIFVDVCPPVLKATSPEVCDDPPGIDRAAVHARVQAAIVKFFRDNL